MKKNTETILNQLYMSAADLKILIPTLGINKAREYIDEIRAEMERKSLFVPKTTPRLALTKLVRKKFGF